MTATHEIAMPAAPFALQDILTFLWREAEMLDRQEYQPWLDLWSDDGLYIIPTEREPQADYAAVLNIVYDDVEMRAARVKKLTSGYATASAPSARTVRTVSRFVVAEETPAELDIRAAMLLAEYKYDRMRTLAADVDYRVVRIDGTLKLARKVVRLINADDFLHGIGYLL